MVLGDFRWAFDTVWKLGLYQKLVDIRLPVNGKNGNGNNSNGKKGNR